MGALEGERRQAGAVLAVLAEGADVLVHEATFASDEEPRFQFYTSAGVGLGWIDSTDEFRQGQGQDFTFNILSAGGLEYRVNERFKVEAGVLYQHLSNAGQTDPNPSLNLFGPQVGATFSF